MKDKFRSGIGFEKKGENSYVIYKVFMVGHVAHVKTLCTCSQSTMRDLLALNRD